MFQKTAVALNAGKCALNLKKKKMDILRDWIYNYGDITVLVGQQ